MNDIQVSLKETSRQAFVFIGDLHFSFADPGPKTINLQSMKVDQRKQLLHSYNRGFLDISDLQILRDSIEHEISPVLNYVTPETLVVTQPEPPEPASPMVTVIKANNNKTKELRGILNNHWATIKKLSLNMSVSEVRMLLDLEKGGKNRQALVKHLKTVLEKHAQTVKSSILPGSPMESEYDPVMDSDVSEVLIPSFTEQL